MGDPPLWAPWRMEYVAAGPGAGCIFCEPRDGRSDRERLVLKRGQHCFALLNRFPYAPGHLMIAPYAHAGRLDSLPAPARQELIESLAQASQVLESNYRCEGLNIGANLGSAAGAGFGDHLHFHLVPRWSGDTNFVTVVGELRVIPMHLEKIYYELCEAFGETK